MIEIPFDEKEKTDNLYKRIKDIVLSKKDNPSYSYTYNQHHLYEENEYPGISKGYYNENGEVTFINSNNQIVTINFSRWHVHKHNGFSGLNGIPCLTCSISIQDKIYWELNVKSGTLYYKAYVTSLDLPLDLLDEKEEILDKPVSEQLDITSTILPSKPIIDITNLQDKYNSSIQDNEELLLKIKKEIETATNDIINKYAKEVEESKKLIKQAKKDLTSFDNLVATYSTFNIDLIGITLQKLITFMESEDYVYQEANHEFKNRVHGPIDSWDEQRNNKVSLVILKQRCQTTYNEDELKILLNQGLCFILDEHSSYQEKKDITFYSSSDGKITCNINYNHFDYVKKFIDYLIRYRYDNNLNTLTNDDMTTILKDFLMDNKDTMINNLDLKISQRILNLKLDNKGVIEC